MSKLRSIIGLGLSLALVAAACGSSSERVETTSPGPGTDTESANNEAAPPETPDDEASGPVETGLTSFSIEVWADNWMAVYVNGELIGEDSVPITTERSFNSETFTFEATYPLTVAIEAKDFKETDSGIEYIGQPNQQMGDGGLIAQVTDATTGEVLASTSSSWSVLVVHRAPLNTDCVDAADPDTECQFEIGDTPADWTDSDFDDSGWDPATEWSADAVDPKQGYLDVNWDPSAKLIWGSDLEIDNTILARFTITEGT